MTRYISNAWLDCYHPGTNPETAPPDIHVPQADLVHATYAQRTNRRKDIGRFELNNADGQYTLDSDGELLARADRLHSGDRVEFHVTFADDGGSFGTGSFGGGGSGGDRQRWTSIIRDVHYEYGSPDKSRIVLTCEDYAFGIMSMRNVYDTFLEVPISGSSDAILDSLLADYAPSLKRGQIDVIATPTSITSDGENLLDVATSLADRADAALIGYRDVVSFREKDALASAGVLTGSDIGPFTVHESDVNVQNVVRVDGAKSSALDDSQETQTAYTTVTDTASVEFEVDTRKSEIDHLELWTRTTGSEDGLVVRIQKANDAGTGPIAPGDPSSDITSKQLSYEFLAADGYTSFLLPQHTLPEPNPWVIVESTGGTGQDIGTDGGTPATPTYKAFYPFFVTVQQSDQQSRFTYRRRDGRISRENISTTEEAQALGNERLSAQSAPTTDWSAPADSLFAHELTPGDLVTLDFDREAAVGDYLVIERSDEYGGGSGSQRLATTLALAFERATPGASGDPVSIASPTASIELGQPTASVIDSAGFDLAAPVSAPTASAPIPTVEAAGATTVTAPASAVTSDAVIPTVDSAASGTTIIEDFERADPLAIYNGEVSNGFTIVSSPEPVFDGEKALRVDANVTGTNIIGTDALGVLPAQGDEWDVPVRLNSGTPRASFMFGIQDATSEATMLDKTYYVVFEVDTNDLELHRRGTPTTDDTAVVLAADENVSYAFGEQLRLNILWDDGTRGGASGDFTVTLYNEAGVQLSQLTANDTNFTSGGIGFWNGTASNANVYFDALTRINP